MKKVLFLAILFVSFTNVWGQNKFPEGYLTDETRPNGFVWLPPPPELTGADFTYDFYYYQWGRQQRNSGLGELALNDESAPINEVFGGMLDITLDYENTPEIMNLYERAVTDALAANKKVKNIFQRTRPFAQFKEASLKPETDEEEAGTYSYPSGHSTRGWMTALVLATVIPEAAEALFFRARLYSLNRVICGHHWKTDIDASLMLATGIFATIVCTDEYQAQLVKARAEYKAIMEKETGVPQASGGKAAASKQAYTINGMPATENSRGIIIQNGQKKIK